MNNNGELQTYGLRRIRLVNFHNFQNETIELHQGGHLFLLGDNGSGKTTLLDAVHYVLSAGHLMEFNSAARVTGKRAEGRRAQGIVMRYNVDTGAMNKNGGVSYAALEMEGRNGRPLTLGVGFSAYSMQEKIHRWGIIKEAPLETIPWLIEENGNQRVCGQREMREQLLEAGGFYNIGAYQKELTRRLYHSEDVFRETCRFLSMGKAYRELAAGAGDYNELFKMLLPEPKSELFERIVDSLRSLDESKNVLEDMEKKLEYLSSLDRTVQEIDACREAMARYQWLETHFTISALKDLAMEHRAREEQFGGELAALKEQILNNRNEQANLESLIADLQSKDAEGAVRQERELSAECDRKLEKTRALEAECGELAQHLDKTGQTIADMREGVNNLASEVINQAGGDRGGTIPGIELISDILKNPSEPEQRKQILDGRPESEWMQGMDSLITANIRKHNRLEIELDGLTADMQRIDEEIKTLEEQKELEPGLEGFSVAKAGLAQRGIRAKPMYEMLEWAPSLGEKDRSLIEEFIGEEILCTFMVEDGGHEAAGAFLLPEFPDLRLRRKEAGSRQVPAWMHNSFDMAKSHPDALECLAQEMEAAHGPFFREVQEQSVVSFRSHERRMRAMPPQWIGAEARKKALQEMIAAALAQSREYNNRLTLLNKAIESTAVGLETLKEDKETVQIRMGTLRSTLNQLTLEEEKRSHVRRDLDTKNRMLAELRQETEHLERRIAGLREKIHREGLEEIEKQIQVLAAERGKLDGMYQQLLRREGAVHGDMEKLANSERERQQNELHAVEELKRREERIRSFRHEITDVAYYVLRTWKGHQFTDADNVAINLRDTERKEAGLQGGLEVKLNDPVFGSVFGFDYSPEANTLVDRRMQPIEDLFKEQARVLEEQRQVVNEQTSGIFRKIVINEMVSFFAGQVIRLESMVRNINKYLASRSFGNTRYRLELQKVDKYRYFVEALHKYNPLDRRSEEVLKQFIEDNKEDIIFSEVDSIPETLDYRNWHLYNLRMYTEDSQGVIMDRRTKSVGSGGEQAVPNYLTILTIAHFLFQGNRIRLRTLLFDEAFYGIDAGRRDQLLGFAEDLQLQLLVASPDQDGVKREVRNSTTLLTVKDVNHDVHLYPFHWDNPADEQLELLEEFAKEKREIHFDQELTSDEPKQSPSKHLRGDET